MNRLLFPTLTITLSIGILGLGGCGKLEIDSPAPVPTTTTIAGIVLAQNEVLRPLDKAGTIVRLEGTDFTATTDENGAYTLQKVPVGQYVLNASRAGMGTMRYEVKVQTLDSVAFPTITLDQYSSTRVTDVAATAKVPASAPDEVAAYQCAVRYNPQLYSFPLTYAIVAYVGKTARVSNTNNSWSYFHSETESARSTAARGETELRIHFEAVQLKRMGFTSGDSVYVAVYGAPQNKANGGIGNTAHYFEPYYVNPTTKVKEQKQVIANLNPNPVRVGFVMP